MTQPMAQIMALSMAQPKTQLMAYIIAHAMAQQKTYNKANAPVNVKVNAYTIEKEYPFVQPMAKPMLYAWLAMP